MYHTECSVLGGVGDRLCYVEVEVEGAMCHGGGGGVYHVEGRCVTWQWKRRWSVLSMFSPVFPSIFPAGSPQ